MGTNFYLRKKLNAQQKQKVKEALDTDQYSKVIDMLPKEIHIGKRSAGWKFLFNCNWFEFFKPNKEDFIKFLKSGQIYDEYGENFTFDQFWNEEIPHRNDLWDIKDYYNSERHSREHRFYVDSSTKEYFKKSWDIDVNQYGEFYIEDLRFTTTSEFC